MLTSIKKHNKTGKVDKRWKKGVQKRWFLSILHLITIVSSRNSILRMSHRALVTGYGPPSPRLPSSQNSPTVQLTLSAKSQRQNPPWVQTHGNVQGQRKEKRSCMSHTTGSVTQTPPFLESTHTHTHTPTSHLPHPHFLYHTHSNARIFLLLAHRSLVYYLAFSVWTKLLRSSGCVCGVINPERQQEGKWQLLFSQLKESKLKICDAHHRWRDSATGVSHNTFTNIHHEVFKLQSASKLH